MFHFFQKAGRYLFVFILKVCRCFETFKSCDINSLLGIFSFVQQLYNNKVVVKYLIVLSVCKMLCLDFEKKLCLLLQTELH